MAEPMSNSQFQSLEIRMKRAEHRLKVVLCLLSLSLCLSASLLIRPKSIHAASPETLRVRELIVVDDAGKERIVIGAPIPDPMVDGKAVKRRVVVGAGIQFKDPDGTERGGIASEDDGSFMFGIDDASGHERAHLYYIPSRGSGVFLQSKSGSNSLSLLNPSDSNKSPKIEILNQAGKTVAEYSAKK
jgi:hypothetical protein